MVENLIPNCRYIQSVLELESCSDANRPRGSKEPDSSSKEPKRLRLSENTEANFLPELKVKEGTNIKTTPFPEKNYPEGSNPSEITKHSLDSSYVLDLMLAKYSE